jgi:hypothetical protein
MKEELSPGKMECPRIGQNQKPEKLKGSVVRIKAEIFR